MLKKLRYIILNINTTLSITMNDTFPCLPLERAHFFEADLVTLPLLVFGVFFFFPLDF